MKTVLKVLFAVLSVALTVRLIQYLIDGAYNRLDRKYVSSEMD